jgi:hypothetical protein
MSMSGCLACTLDGEDGCDMLISGGNVVASHAIQASLL